MRINHNIPALRSLNQLNKTNSSLDKTLERLSSGLRINRAADDAAGMAITQKMDTQVRGLKQAARNAMDGISMIQTAEGALNEVHAMLQRIRELSVQVSNGTYDSSDRKAVQDEVNQLQEEIKRISEHIEFNERKLLNGEIDRRAYSSKTELSLISLSDTVKADKYELIVTQDAHRATLLGKPMDPSVGLTGGVLSVSGKININGEEITVNVGDTANDVYGKLRELAERTNTIVTPVAAGATDSSTPVTFTTFNNSTKLVFESKEYGSEAKMEIYCDNPDLRSLLGIDNHSVVGEDVKADFTATRVGFSSTATISTKGNIITVTDVNGFVMKFEPKVGAAKTTYFNKVMDGTTTPPTSPTLDPTGLQAFIDVLDAGPLDLQIGANEGQFMEVRIPNMSPKALGIDGINLGTADGAQKAITAVDAAINMVSSMRSKLGAYQNRLEHTIANLNVAAENMTESLSRILDADMALEMSEYTQKNVLAQAGTSMLAQANQRPQTVLQLLNN